MKETPFLEDPQAALDILQGFTGLKGLSFLGRLDDSHLQSIFGMSMLRSYAAGEVILTEGSYDTTLYILLSGDVKIMKHGIVVAWLRQPGDVFGELAIVDAMPRSADAIALRETACLAMDAASLDRLPPTDQAVIHAILYKSLAQVVTERLRSTSEELASLKRVIMAGSVL